MSPPSPPPQKAASASEATEASNLFGKYEVGKLIGCGAFAKVYHARNVKTGQSVAIKSVSKQKIVKNGLTAHVKREIEIMRRLRHPHIVKLHEVLATKTKIHFVMDFAKGGELFAKVSRGRFSEDLSRRYFQQLISAVGYCHARGVFHRDLKPENLLLDENWDLKVSDFGLSAVKDQIRPDGLLHTLCGTPAYVAPEILAKKGYDGAKVDIWSCGIVLFVLIAGYLPFNDPNLMVMYRKIYTGDFRCPKWTSPDLNRLLHRLLETDPGRRITVDEIIRDPWFCKGGYKEAKIFNEDLEFKEFGGFDENKCLNAFDIISFSSGFSLSGLFSGYTDLSISSERFVSDKTPEQIIEMIEEVVKGEEDERLIVYKKDGGVKLEGQNGNFVVLVEFFRLTEKFIVVEVRKGECCYTQCPTIWSHRLKLELDRLMYKS